MMCCSNDVSLKTNHSKFILTSISFGDHTMAPQAYSKVVKAITSKKLKEPFYPHEATKACRPNNPDTFRKIFSSYRRGNPFGKQPLFIQLKDGTYKAIRTFQKIIDQ